MKVTVLVLLFIFSLGTLLTPSYQNSQCICGTKKVLLVLADFPEYPHLSSQDEISTLFFGRVARYFQDVSYGRLAVSGNSTSWIRLPRLYSQYVGSDPIQGVMTVARDAFGLASKSFNMSAFSSVFLILSFYPSQTGDFVPTYGHGIGTSTGMVTGFAVIEEDRDWSAYAHALALSFGLWRLQAQLSGLGTNDLAANGDGDMSAWSKAALGWINDSQVTSVDASGAGATATIDPVEDPGSDALALQVSVVGSAGEYWVEVRQPIGYDRNNLQEYGAIVSYIASSNTSMQFRKVLQPDIISKAVFLDPTSDISIVVLNVTQGRFHLLVGDAQVGRDAQTAIYALSRAQDTIQAAGTANRYQNLDLAQKLLVNARQLFSVGRFGDASALAVSAETTASAATVPPDYPQVVLLLGTAEALKNDTSSYGSYPSFSLVQQANAQLDVAKQAFELRDFSTAKQAAQSAIDLYNRAKQMELYKTIISWLSNLVLIVPVIILAFALRYQLKGA